MGEEKQVDKIREFLLKNECSCARVSDWSTDSSGSSNRQMLDKLLSEKRGDNLEYLIVASDSGYQLFYKPSSSYQSSSDKVKVSSSKVKSYTINPDGSTECISDEKEEYAIIDSSTIQYSDEPSAVDINGERIFKYNEHGIRFDYPGNYIFVGPKNFIESLEKLSEDRKKNIQSKLNPNGEITRVV